MKKIVFFGGDLNRSGGTERVSSLIANGLSRRGFDVLMVSFQCGDKPFFELDYSIRVKSLFPNAGRNLLRTYQLIARLRRLLIEERADVLIGVESMLALFTVPATIGLSVRNICWEHFHFKIDLGRRGRRFARYLAAWFCDDVVTLTDKDKSYWQQGSQLKAAICAIPNPLPFSVRDSHIPPASNRIVLAVGRLTPQKGFDLLLSTWQKVLSEEPSWRLRIVGSGEDEQKLKQLCGELGISESVGFYPATADIETHYRVAAIYCLCSRFEGFPMVVLEGIAFGIPFVSFDCDTGPAEILLGTGAQLVPNGDIDALANAVIRLIRDPQERDAISKAEKIRAEAFHPNKVVDKWVELLS
ncbi:MAG: glycosyltransferase family 4 protein [Polaromonas sp.]